MKRPKSSSEVTLAQWELLAKASIDLLGCARLMFWLNGSEGSSPDDPSIKNCLNRMASRLKSVGLPQVTIEDFDKNIEEMLTSGIPPNKWRTEKRKIEKDLAYQKRKRPE